MRSHVLPPLHAVRTRIIPWHTQVPLPLASSSRVGRHVYWLADGRRDIERIALLLHKPSSIINGQSKILEHQGYLFLATQRKVITMNIDLLKASFTAVASAGGTVFAERFYENLFQMYPATRAFFAETDMKRQAGALTATLSAVIAGAERRENLVPYLHILGEKHARRYHVLPEHYPLVGATLLETFHQMLGTEFTQEYQDAWNEAFEIISTTMINYPPSSPPPPQHQPPQEPARER